MAAPIQLSFGLRTQVGPRNHVLDGGPDVLRDVAMATVFLRRRCGLMSNNFDHLFFVFNATACR